MQNATGMPTLSVFSRYSLDLISKALYNEIMNRKIQGFITEVLELLGAYGEKKVLNKKYLLDIYNKHVKRKGN